MLWTPIKISVKIIDIPSIIIERFKFLKRYPLNIAAVITGVKFGGCGINLENTKILIKNIGKKYIFENFLIIFQHYTLK